MADTEKTVSRGRPRGFDVDAGVAIAAGLFRARGYDAVGVAELARAIGINPPSLYAAYGSKKALFERALDHYRATDGAFFAEALSAPGSIETRLANLLRRAARHYADDGGGAGCLVMDGTRNCADAETDGLGRDVRAAARDWLAARIAEAGAADPDVLADYVMAVLGGLSAMARDGWSADRLGKIAARAAAGLDRPG